MQVSPGDRLGWTQQAPDAADIALFNLRSTSTEPARRSPARTVHDAGAAFECSAVLPTLQRGHAHARACGLRHRRLGHDRKRAVAGSSRGVAVRAGSSVLIIVHLVVTADQARLNLSPVVEGLNLPIGSCIFGGRLHLRCRARRHRAHRFRRRGLVEDAALDLSREITLPEGGLLAIALDPKFDENGLTYVALCRCGAARRAGVHACALPLRGRHFRRAGGAARQDASVGLRRERGAANRFRRQVVCRTRQLVRRHLSPAALPRTTARSCGSTSMRRRRTISPDEPPILSFDHPQPQALDWQPATGKLWVVDRVAADAGRLSAIANDPSRTARHSGPHMRCRREPAQRLRVLSRRSDAVLPGQSVPRRRDGPRAHASTLRS